MKCCQKVSPDTWHFYPCKCEARYLYTPPNGEAMPLCGRHAQRYLRKFPERITALDTAKERSHDLG